MGTEKMRAARLVRNGFFLVFLLVILSVVVEAQSYYYLTVKTGDRGNAGTNAKVFAKLKGTVSGESKWIELNNPRKIDFQRNSSAEYNLGRHSLGGVVQVRFMVMSNNTIDESWFLEWFEIREKSRVRSRRRHRQTVKTWVHPGKMNPYYFTRLKGRLNPVSRPVQPNFDLTGLVLVPRSDGTFEFRRSGSVPSGAANRRVKLVPISDGTFRADETRLGTPSVVRATRTERSMKYEDCSGSNLRIIRDPDNPNRYICIEDGSIRGRVANQNPFIDSPDRQMIETAVAPSAFKPVVYFDNKTDGDVMVYRVENGVEMHHQTVYPGSRGFETTGAGQRWIVRRNGRRVGAYLANDRAYQLVTVSAQITEAVRLVVRP